MNPNHWHLNLRYNGFSLLELILAMSLSTILIIISGESYVKLYTSYRYLQNNTVLQENAYAATAFLQQAFTHSGFLACTNLTASLPIKNHSLPKKPLQAIIGYLSNSADLPIPTYIRSHLKPNSLVIEIMDMSNENFLSKPMTKFSAAKVAHTNLQQKDYAIITDCQQAEIVQVKQARQHHHENQLIFSTALDNKYDDRAMIGKFEDTFYYLAQTKRYTHHKIPIFALYRYNNNDGEEELVENVSEWKFLFGIKTQASAITKYLSAKEVTSKNIWQYVASVSIHLLIVSNDEILPTAETYSFADNSFLAPDKRLYREWDNYFVLLQRH